MTSPKAYDIFSEISEYTPKIIPFPPSEWVEFKNMSKYKQEEGKDAFYRLPEITGWLEAKWQAELFNRDCFIRLHELYSGPATRAEKARLVELMNSFRKHILQNQRAYKALALDFAQYRYELEPELGDYLL